MATPSPSLVVIRFVQIRLDSTAKNGLTPRFQNTRLGKILNETKHNIVQKGEKMNTINKIAEKEVVKINVKMKLSALWVALMLIYAYADILSLFKAGAIEKMMDGFMGPFPVTQGSLLSASILMMIPAVMVFLALALKAKVNRWVNIILGVLYTFVNISNLIGETWIYYISFVVVEIALTLLIVWFAWRWPNPEG